MTARELARSFVHSGDVSESELSETATAQLAAAGALDPLAVKVCTSLVVAARLLVLCNYDEEWAARMVRDVNRDRLAGKAWPGQ